MRFEPTVRPITKWPQDKIENPGSKYRFRASWTDTKDKIGRELEKADADPATITLGMFVNPNDVQKNGTRLYADRRPYEPGVILSFRRYGDAREISYPCDAFDFWQANVRAIALSLEKLRQVEQYGVFKYADIVDRLALPSAEGKATTREQAAATLSAFSHYSPTQILLDSEYAKRAYRQAALKTHVDHGGDVYDFEAVQAAKAILFL